MATYRIVLFKHKPANAQGHPLMIRVTEDRKSRYMSLGLRCKLEEVG